MKVIVAASSYWNSQEEFDSKYEGNSDHLSDPVLYLVPDYQGKYGLRWWKQRVDTWFHPDVTILTCGTWSDPKYSRFTDVLVLNGGVDCNQPHTKNWAYVGCAMTALCAYLCNRRDWDLMLFVEPDYLLGAVDWKATIEEFMRRPEIVFGAPWGDLASDLMGWKPEACRRFLHCRLRPNLSTDTKLMWIDNELDLMFHKDWWNPWPHIRTTRYDYGWESTSKGPVEDTLAWPYIRLPHPSIIDRYERECTSKAVPLR
jgi:hypothetical protein